VAIKIINQAELVMKNIYTHKIKKIAKAAKALFMRAISFLKGAAQDKDLEHLSHTSLIEEAESKPRYSMIIWTVVGMVLLFLAWANFTTVKTRVSSSGNIKTNRPIQTIQHYEGGILEHLYVQEGQIVQEGDDLVTVASSVTESELMKLRSRYFVQKTSLARLRALVSNDAPDFPLPGNESERKIIEDQKLLLKTQRQSTEKQKEILGTKINQKKAEYIQLQRKIEGQKQQLSTIAEELSIQKKLWDKRLLSKTSYLETKQDFEELQTSVQETEASLARAGEALQESQQALVEFEARTQNQSFDEIGEISSEKLETESSLAAIEDRAGRLTVTAPTMGIVKNISIATIGATVRNGQDIMEIIPIDDELFVEVRVNPQDIADISLEDQAFVKVSAYEFTEYGQIQGKVRYISPDTFLDEAENKTFYLAHIMLDQQFVGDNPENVIVPGMQTQVDIIAGEQTILRYLFKPVIRAVDRLFTER
jgi:adhesin transport system membrane fusion protein